ncbi:hypothetical protein CIRMBP1196_01628 [Enterococcus cecorum]|nr:hypothetical protein CIRMBP1196_01628 [Enterococcus cecorum]
MRLNDFYNIIEFIKQDVLNSETEYLKLLKVVGNNQRYDFRSQLSIYDKQPNAVACTKFDDWRERFGRTVMRGQKGIPILEDHGSYKKVEYIFDLSQTVSKNRALNEVRLWQYQEKQHSKILKDMIEEKGYEASDNTLENIFSLVRVYGDEKIDSLMNEFRVDDEDRLSFVKFVRDSISYAVASRFKIEYPMDFSILQEHIKNLDSTSLMQLGETVSDISGNVIDTTIQKSKDLELAQSIRKERAYNVNREEKEENDLFRGSNQERNDENERVFRNGEYGRDSRENQREHIEPVRGTDGLYQGISQSDVRSDEAELAFNGDGNYCPGEWCQFCRAAVKCRARAEAKMKLATFEFALPPLLSDEEIADILSSIGELTNWANEIIAYATDAAVNHGKKWPGFKVVEGRSNRKYKDEEAAKNAGYRDIYKQSLITITEMEKLMGNSKFNEIIGELVMKPPGKPTLVPVSDKRPEMNTSSAKNDFMEV